MTRLIEKVTLAKLDVSYIKLLNHLESKPSSNAVLCVAVIKNSFADKIQSCIAEKK